MKSGQFNGCHLKSSKGLQNLSKRVKNIVQMTTVRLQTKADDRQTDISSYD